MNGMITRVIESVRNPYLIDGYVGRMNGECITWCESTNDGGEDSREAVDSVDATDCNDANTDALAQAVIRGDYGNGAKRRERLGALYDCVQARVDELLV